MAQFYPSGMLGVGLTALMASFMSGMAGNVTAFNTVFTYDIYQSYIRPNAPDAHYLTVGRITTVVGRRCSPSATAYLAAQLQQHHGFPAAGLRLRERAAVCHVPAGHVLEARHRPRGVLRLARRHRRGCRSLTALTVAEGKGGWIAQRARLPLPDGAEFLDRHLRLDRLFPRDHPGQPRHRSATPIPKLRGLVYGLTELPREEGVSWYLSPRRWPCWWLRVVVLLNLIFR